MQPGQLDHTFAWWSITSSIVVASARQIYHDIPEPIGIKHQAHPTPILTRYARYIHREFNPNKTCRMESKYVCIDLCHMVIYHIWWYLVIPPSLVRSSWNRKMDLVLTHMYIEATSKFEVVHEFIFLQMINTYMHSRGNTHMNAVMGSHKKCTHVHMHARSLACMHTHARMQAWKYMQISSNAKEDPTDLHALHEAYTKFTWIDAKGAGNPIGLGTISVAHWLFTWGVTTEITYISNHHTEIIMNTPGILDIIWFSTYDIMACIVCLTME